MCYNSTVVGNMKGQKVNCSHFMSFCSIDFIFIGEIRNYLKFLWVHRNFEFRPANQIFRENTKICFFKNGHFSLDDVKNERYVKTTLYIESMLWIRVQMTLRDISWIFLSLCQQYFKMDYTMKIVYFHKKSKNSIASTAIRNGPIRNPR